VRLVWHYLQRDQLRVSARTRPQLDALRERTIDLIDRIEAEHAFAPRPSALCTWCEFNHLCPAASDRAAIARSEAKPSEVNRRATAQQPSIARSEGTPLTPGQGDRLEYRPAPAERARAAREAREVSRRATAQQPAERASSGRATARQPAPSGVAPQPSQLALL
jgi:hypothetical protein